MPISYRSGKFPVALAAIAAMTSIPAAAAVISVSGLSTNVAAGTTYTLDANMDGSTDVSLFNNFSSGYAQLQGLGTTLAPVAAGTSIGALPFTGNPADPKYYTFFPGQINLSNSTGIVDNALGDNLYLPFSFGAGSATNYGWLDLSVRNPNVAGAVTSAYEVTVNGYAYDDTGAAILAGATAAEVPEPSSLLLLAAGFAGFSALRRRSRKNAFSA